MKKVGIVIAILVIFSLLMIGCGGEKTTTPATTTGTPATTTAAPTTKAPKYGGTINVIQDASPRVPGGWPWELFGNDSFCPQFIFDPLLRADNKGNLVPWLAESYKLADDYSSVTFTLRKGVKFTDGSDLNAEVAKWCLDNAITAKISAYWKSVDIIDNYNVRLNFTVNKSTWNNTLLFTLVDGAGVWMVSYEAFKAHDKNWMIMNPIGTGPFVFDSFAADSYYDVVRNKGYWKKDEQGNQLPYLDKIHTLFATDLQTRTALVQAGQADATTYEPGKTSIDLEALSMRLIEYATGPALIKPDTLNHDSPWAIKKVREALEYCIDREAIAQGFSYGRWEAPYGLAAKTAPCYDPNYIGRRYDLAKAKQLMKEAGKESGFSCKMIVAPQGLDRDLLAAIVTYLSKINITVTLEFPDGAKMRSMTMAALPSGTLIIEIGGPMGGSWNRWAGVYSPYTTSNFNWERTPEFKALWDASLSSPKEDESLVKAMLKYIQDECLLTPVSLSGKSWAEKPYVMSAGFQTRSYNPWWTFEKCWLDK
jgi:peptide/nickel transport system substrate-binding protein